MNYCDDLRPYTIRDIQRLKSIQGEIGVGDAKWVDTKFYVSQIWGDWLKWLPIRMRDTADECMLLMQLEPAFQWWTISDKVMDDE